MTTPDPAADEPTTPSVEATDAPGAHIDDTESDEIERMRYLAIERLFEIGRAVERRTDSAR